MRIFLAVIAVLILLFVGWLSLFTVDRGEYVYLTQFGRHLQTFDGVTDGGLHSKLPWPINAVQSLDRRLQYFDLPEMELLTHDPERKTIDKTLTIVASVCWRIKDKDSVDVFVRRLGTPDRARGVLGEQVRGQLGSLISKKRMDELIRVEAKPAADGLSEMEKLQQEMLQKVPADEYGISIVDIRLRRINHPTAVREAIFARIRSERQKKVADYQSEGARLAENIRTDADKKAREMLAEATAEEQKLRGQAATEADSIRNQAHKQDVEFYAFLKKLEEYQRILGDNKSMLLLSSRGGLFDLLSNPPKVNGMMEKAVTPMKTPLPGGQE